MATGTTTTTRPAAGSAVPRDQFVLQQVNRARRHLRMIELGAALMALVAGVLVGLLLLAVVDHWVWSFGPVTRWLALIGLAIAAGLYAWRFVLPPLIHSVNPLYAARAIERNEASLKNSLVNFLFLRQHPESISGVVLDTLGRTAATDLQRISVDASIDRTRLIRILYFLTAALALCAAYKVFSPKDPLQSAYRVLMPWTDVSAVSRVSILEVQPGDTTGVLDESIQVTARVRGARPDDKVYLLCTSSDQQQVDRPVEMVVGSDGRTYEASIPPGGSGLKQNWTYRVRAGDALSREYRIQLEAKPLIAVQRIEYDFPEYTQRPRQVVEGQGDIEALEGTRVTLRAKANKPIRSAYIEWDPGARATRENSAPVAPLDMESSGTEATVQFVLKLGEDRRTPPYNRYQLRFVTEEGQQNVDPIEHRITIFPDLAPVVDILSPPRRPMEIPENGRLPIEVRALDPDFGLTSVKLVGSAGTERNLSHELLSESSAWRGQFVAKFDFVPRDWGFVEGDEVVYRAVARDNRHGPGGALEPNEQRTQDYRVTIVAPLESPATRDERDSEAGQREEESEQSEDASDDGEQQESPAEQPSDMDSDSSEPSPDSDPSGSEPENGESSPESGGEGDEQGTGQSGGDQPGDPQDSDGSGSASGESSSEEGAGDSQGDGGGEASDDSALGGQSERGDSREPGAEGGAAEPGDPGDDGGGSEGGEARSPDDLHDGDVFDHIRRRLERAQGDSAGAEGAPSDQDDWNERDTRGGDDPSGDAGEGGEPMNSFGGSATEGESEASERGKPALPDVPQDATERAPPGENEGGSPDGAAQLDAQEEKSMEDGETTGSEPGAGQTTQAGAGNRTEDSDGHGTPPDGFENRDSAKFEEPDVREEQEERDPPGLSTSDHQGDKQSDNATGDQSGGGGEGAGQSAKLPGADSSGTQEASDEGAGAAEQSGDGEPGTDGGQQRSGEAPTGSPGSDAGEGSTSRPKPEGDTPGDVESPSESPMPEAGPDASDDGPQAPAATSTAGTQEQGNAGEPAGGGIGTDAPQGGARHAPPPLSEEREQIEFADRATDLVLEHLRNQQQNPDQELLDELGWSPEDLREFVRRWDRLKKAPATDPDARRELDESLRSLGLRPPRDEVRRGTSVEDTQRGNSDDALRSAPPSRYFEQFNAFRKGSARSSDDRSNRER
jgi:hypothetical protein